ncbi:MAG: hypothetical protein GTO46_06250 [Gemmatimonadetes bacterium]|nr:hypothetical protein [Gemmatimonadota bacterium]NIO31206.1 hypothetical protein [Gemmatimonadota bacterium]
MHSTRAVPHIVRLSLSTVLLGLAAAVSGGPALAQGPVVRAVLFFSPTCPHCHDVINEDLPVIFDRFGGQPRIYFDTTVARAQVAFYDVSNGQVDILLVDVSKLEGNLVFRDATRRFQIESTGVPRLIVGDSVLIGSRDIPRELPLLIAEGLAGSGIDWPVISGLQTALAAIPGRPLAAAELESAAAGEPVAEVSAEGEEAEEAPPTPQPQPDSPEEATPQAPAETEPVPAPEGAPDERAGEAEEAGPEGGAAPESPPEEGPTATPPVAAPEGSEAEPAEAPGPESDSALAVIPVYKPTMIELYRQDPIGNSVSVLVLIGMVLSLALVGLMMGAPTLEGRLTVAVPLIAAIGIGVAAYLTYIESSGATAVCGPVGDCNTVNQSEYAILFGVIPIAALGLVGYVAVILGWSVARLGSGRAADWAKLALLVLCVIGTLFSVYLTFLEPFVIGATCAWCLTSAVAITVLMLLSARPGLDALARIRTS